MSSKVEDTKRRDDDPQAIFKTLTEIVNECIRRLEKKEKLNINKVYDYFPKSSNSSRLNLNVRQEIN